MCWWWKGSDRQLTWDINNVRSSSNQEIINLETFFFIYIFLSPCSFFLDPPCVGNGVVGYYKAQICKTKT
jgi:hypothetical protein